LGFPFFADAFFARFGSVATKSTLRVTHFFNPASV
jgi:hypothetical protein